MQFLAAYLLSRREPSGDGAQLRASAVQDLLSTWLTEKGASDSYASSGEFASLSANSIGSFQRLVWTTKSGSVNRLILQEKTDSGQIFTTAVSMAVYGELVDVYCTLSVANVDSLVAPLPADARCPRVIRDLVSSEVKWTIENYSIPSPVPEVLLGAEGARRLVEEIRSPSRKLPLVVVSQDDDGNIIWPHLDDYIAADLAGLAKIFRIDDEATWALSEQVGKLHSCYGGAVRLYWPSRGDEKTDSTVASKVWTPYSLVASDLQGQGRARLRKTISRIVLSTSAIAISPPPIVAQIQREFVRESLDGLRGGGAETKEIIQLYSDENRELKDQIDQLRGQLSQQTFHLRALQHALSAKEMVSENADDEVPSGDRQPAPGEIRYYKKTGSSGAYDRMIETNDCGCDNWESANSADKAKRGLEKATDRSDWKNLWHCATCKNGGMWKVKW